MSGNLSVYDYNKYSRVYGNMSRQNEEKAVKVIKVTGSGSGKGKKKEPNHRREYRLEVRLLDSERSRLQVYADSKGVSLSEAVRDWVKALPEPNASPDS